MAEEFFSEWIGKRVVLRTTDKNSIAYVGTLKKSTGTTVMLTEVTPRLETRHLPDMTVNVANHPWESLTLVAGSYEDPSQPKD
jgi:hypothetical protein